MADKKETKPKKQVKDENRKPVICFAPIGANALKIEIRNGTPKDINSDIIELNGKIEIENFGTHTFEVNKGRVFRTQEGKMAKSGEVGNSDLPWLQAIKERAIEDAKEAIKKEVTEIESVKKAKEKVEKMEKKEASKTNKPKQSRKKVAEMDLKAEKTKDEKQVGRKLQGKGRD